MKSIWWSFGATLLAAAVLTIASAVDTAPSLQWLGAGCGGALALAGVILGFQRGGGPRDGGLPIPTTARFFVERRRAPRHAVSFPVNLRVNGSACRAQLLSVSSSGALLRLQPRPGEQLAARVGEPVAIDDYPAGTITRIGSSGVYVDFAVAFEPTRAPSLASRAS
jgi:hypothetical protein